uniref:Acetyl-coenzyme A transporter 1 n=1 Tax=Rhabditophanes sp. KR3021 TaxID=114890 RepID=A0AC35U5D7_9BILA
MEMSEEMTSRRNRKRVNDDDNATHFSMTHSEDVMAFEGAYDTPILANTPLIFKSNFYPPDKSCKSKDEDKKSSSFRAFLSSIHGDENSLALLLVLYFLQGIPLGIMGCIPLILSENKASLADQSFFSFSSYPFSAKLLWAPIVDSIWIRKIGRRKTWLLPTQFLISLYLFGLSYSINDLLPHSETTNIAASIKILTFVFLPLNFLAATQDIAVDGWALTMLSRKNVGYASTCNVIGQHAGVFFGHNVFLFLSSEKYTNRFFRSTKGTGGLIEFSGFLLFWCAIFFITTTLVFLFKKEVDNSKSPSNDNHKKNDLPIESSDIKGNNTSLMNPDHHVDNDDEMELGIGETYSTLWKIILLKPMAMLLFVMFTNKFAFSAASSTTFLKLIEIGVDKEDISMLNVFLSPLAFVLPIFIGKFTVGQSPLNCFLYAYPLRLLINGLYSGLVYVSPWFQDADGSYPYHFYGIWLGAMLLHDSLSIVMFLSIMAFFAKISDPKIGGTYMTMLNTISNLGGMISGTVTMRFMDFVTYKNCYTKDTFEFVSVCNNKADALTCKTSGNSCQTDVDGYFITVAVGTVYGVIWLIFLWNRIKRFQHIPQSEWLVFKKNN